MTKNTVKADRFNNRLAQEGCDRCYCGCKYWENDRCVDCGQVYSVDRACALPDCGNMATFWGVCDDHADEVRSTDA